MNNGLLYIHDGGPSVISGDPQCGKCGGMEFRWVGTCVKCQDKEIDRWKELKRLIQIEVDAILNSMEPSDHFIKFGTLKMIQRMMHTLEGL